MNNVRYHNDEDYDGFKLKQLDGHNCGPIACMVLWHTFVPSEVDTKWPVTEYRSMIVTKMTELLQSAKALCDILVSQRENHLETKDKPLLSSDDDDEGDKLWRTHLTLTGKEKIIPNN